jgi:urocanate reductase
MERPMKPGRRQFIKNTALAGGAIATTGALGASSASAAVLPEKWDKVADVVVIGSGIAGMSAAVEAADGGAKVVVLEKDSVAGGAAKFSGGHMIVAGTDVQARANIEDKPDWLYRDMMADSEYRAVPELIRTYVDGGPEHIRWLEGLGIRFTSFFQHTSNADRIKEGVFRGHQIAPSPDYPGGRPLANGGLGLMTMLIRGAESRGAAILLGHKMTRIVRSGERGPVIGVEAVVEGKTLAIKARRGVIIATGGWSGNLQMGLAEDPRLTPDIYPDCWPYHLCLGEGHIAAVDAGATLGNMAWGGYLVPRWGTRVYQLWEPQTFDNVPTINVGMRLVDFDRAILVKGDGKRYVNESLGDSEGTQDPNISKFIIKADSYPNHPFITAYLDLAERPRNVWAVTDAEGAKRLGWLLHKDQIENPDPKSGIALYPEMVAVADNLKDLATRMKVDPQGLETTITRYNRFVETGKDEDFGKSGMASAIAQGPYYAMKMALLKHTRRNGIRGNTRGQVLDRAGLSASSEGPGASIDEQQTISRLFAAGECAHYLGCFHSHGTLGVYSFFGRVAGRSAAAEPALE